MSLHSFGDWELRSCLGQGGFGEVLLWRNRRTKEDVATKRLKENKRLSKDELCKLKQRWTQEYQWMNELNTPYIVRGIDVQDKAFIAYLNEHHAWKPLPVIVMEYCNSGDLRGHLEHVTNTNGLHEFEVREILNALRHAIEYLHVQCCIEHRDLKPDNIVIHQAPNARKKCYKLTDFGFARKCTENTILKSVVGTRHYFAPEVVDTALYTNTVDYWSLGIIAFELMCGILPFIPHQELFQIIVNIKRKPKHCIAITENPEEPNRFHFQSEIFTENRMSHIFRSKMKKWLRLALDVNYKTRGTETIETTQAPMNESQNSNNVLKIYSELDAILQSRILTVFCLNTFKLCFYEVTPEQNLIKLIEALEQDTGLARNQLFFVYPTGHPRGQLNANTKPIDIFVEEWQDTSDSLNPPVMLYLVGFQCDFNAADPNISSIIKRCLQLSITSDTKLTPNWLMQQFTQHTHFLLSNEQRHLEMMMQGLREYALTMENDIFNYDEAVQVLLEEILILRGAVNQFESTIRLAKQAQDNKGQNNSSLFDSWLQKAAALKQEVETIDINVGQSIKKRYKSALRRIKEQATNQLFDEFIKRDIYALNDFQKHLLSTKQDFRASTQLEYCQKAVYNCIEKRNIFLSDEQLRCARDTIAEVHQEFIKIKNIINDARKYNNKLQGNLNQSTYEFHSQLLETNLKPAMNNNALNLSNPMLASTISNCIAQSQLYTPNGPCASLADILKLPTDSLIQEAIQNLELMSVDIDENNSDIPRTIDFR